MTSKGQVEAAVTVSLTRFEREHLGRGPREARSHLIGDMIVVRLQGILSPAEQKLGHTQGGVELIKQMRSRLIESSAPEIIRLVEEACGAEVNSMHTDISSRTGERVFVFVLDRDLDAEIAEAELQT